MLAVVVAEVMVLKKLCMRSVRGAEDGSRGSSQLRG